MNDDYKALLRDASNVAAVVKVIVEMSDEVARGASPLDTQGRLLRLQSIIQKNRPRVVKIVDALCDRIVASGGKLAGDAT